MAVSSHYRAHHLAIRLEHRTYSITELTFSTTNDAYAALTLTIHSLATALKTHWSEARITALSRGPELNGAETISQADHGVEGYRSFLGFVSVNTAASRPST